jgi:phosphate butyryltransferase
MKPEKITKLSDLNYFIETRERKRLVVVAAHDEHVLDAVMEARTRGIAEPVLVGDEKRIRKTAVSRGYDLSGTRIIDEPDNERAAETAVSLVHGNEGDILMKGLVDTASFLRPVLHKTRGLRRGEILSSIALVELANYHKIFLLTDGGLNIDPDLKTKIAILKNAVFFMRRCGIEIPKVAVLGAYELINETMEATVHAALLSQMAQRGQIRNCVIDGPLSIDNAISRRSAEFKGIVNEVAGDADILLCPNIETANVLYKSVVYLAGAGTAGLILGASAPIVLTSRADSEQVKLNSIAAAAGVDIS